MNDLKRIIKKTPLIGKVALKVHTLRIKKNIRKDLLNLFNKESNKPKIFIFLCDTYGNLGDVALRYIQRRFLEENFKSYTQILVTDLDLRHGGDILKQYIQKEDILTLVGGGNFGNQYMDTENDRRYVIENFPENKIICFPQSIYFTNNKEGEIEKERAIKIYNNHMNLTLALRDTMSYEIAKSLFTNANILLTTDIVLTLTEFQYNYKRTGALFLMRADVEKTLQEGEFNLLNQIVKKKFSKVAYSDTIISENVGHDRQYEVLDKKLAEIANAKIVITDRLHGMIFCAITNTPCIVLSNYNHKIKYQYEWIKHLNYIKYLEDISEFEDSLSNLIEVEPMKYDSSFTASYFKEIIKVMKS
ncbi:MAG: polysaccharide pyruvyl transferase family protein [Solibacillus sp.]